MRTKISAGALVAIVVGCVYVAGSATATAVAPGLAPAEIASQVRELRYEAAVKGLSAVHKATRARCESQVGVEKGNCRTQARMEYKRAIKSARAD